MDTLIVIALAAVVLIAVVVALFTPAMIAGARRHRSWMAITAVCLFFGWTIVGWLIALIWSLGDTGERRY